MKHSPTWQETKSARFQHSERQRCRKSLRLVLALALLLVVVLPSTVSGVAVASAHPLSGSSSYLAVLLDSPAVVRIISVGQGKLICHTCAPDGSNIVSPPDDMFPPKSTGSGAFVSPDGYILTADHVVDHTNNNTDDVSSIKKQAIQDIAQRYGMLPADVSSFLHQHQHQLEIDIQTVSQKVFLSTAYTGDLQTIGQVISYPVTRIVAHSPINQQDVAIIKVAAQDRPNLTLALDKTVNVGEHVTAIAFPASLGASSNTGTSDISSCLFNFSTCDLDTVSRLLTPTQEQGQITQNISGSFYETSPIGSPGSSGGAVIDEQGRIIGFVDKGTDSERTGSGGITILVSSRVASEYVKQAGITNAGQGTFESAWTKAMTEYEATDPCHFTNAAKDLATLSKNYPQFEAVLPILHDAQSQATSNECPPPIWPLFGLIGGGVALILLVILGVVLMRRRKQGRLVLVAAGAEYNTVPASGSMPGRTPRADMAPGAGSPVYHPSLAPGVRRCANGHLVIDTHARVCPNCGAALQRVPQ